MEIRIFERRLLMEKKKSPGWVRTPVILVLMAAVAVLIVAFWSAYKSLENREKEIVSLKADLTKEKEIVAKLKAELVKVQGERDGLKAEAEQLKTAKDEAEAKARAWQEQYNIAIAEATEGVEHTFIRQLAKGDKSDKKFLKLAQTEAERIACLARYKDVKTRREIRIGGKGGNTAYVLIFDSSGKKVIRVDEYKLGKDKKFKFATSRELAPNFKDAGFLGDFKDKIQDYQYIYDPKKRTGKLKP